MVGKKESNFQIRKEKLLFERGSTRIGEAIR